MDRRLFLRRSLGAVLGLGLAGRLPAATAAAPEALPWSLPGADPVADLRAWAARVVASGGLCAPVTPFYSLTNLTRVNEILPSFKADRGGLRYARPEGP